jgi:hypothetical protein
LSKEISVFRSSAARSTRTGLLRLGLSCSRHSSFGKTQPLAEFDASRLGGEYGYDEERNCWWASDTRGQRYRFEVKEVPSTDIAA